MKVIMLNINVLYIIAQRWRKIEQ